MRNALLASLVVPFLLLVTHCSSSSNDEAPALDGGNVETGPAGDGGPNTDGAPPACSAALDCPAAAECMQAATCVDHLCQYTPVFKGIACGAGVDKCHTQSCDGAGTCEGVPIVCATPPVAAVPASCPSGTTFKAALGGECNTSCDPAVGCVYGTVDIPCPDGVAQAGGTLLPTDWAYQAKLRSYLATLTSADFDTTSAIPTFDPAAPLSDDDLYQLWIGAHYDTYMGNLPNAGLLRSVPSSKFTLAAMESTTPPKVHPGGATGSLPIGALFYGDWHYAGNPFYGAPGVLKRIFAMTSADLMLMDQNTSQGGGNLDEMSGALPNYGLVGARIRGEASIDVCVRAAYNVGLRRLFDWFEPKNVGNGNGDMLIAQVEGYAWMAEALGDADARVRAAAKAKAQIDAICDPAGFCLHQGGGYDPNYEGWTQNHVSVAALVSKWPHVVDFAKAVHDLRAYTSLPQPETIGPVWARTQACIGPSEYAPAAPFPACTFGGDDAYGRDSATAQLTDNAVYLVTGGQPGTPAYPDASFMKADIASSRGLERAWSFNGDGAADLATWEPRHYPRGVSAGMILYEPGTYAALGAKVAADPDLAKLPVLRTADYVKALGASDATHQPQFLVAKYGGADPFSVIVHTGFIDTMYEGAGLGGGELAGFWTKTGGTALLGWNTGRNYTFGQSGSGPWYAWHNWKKWPAHVVSGRSGSAIFSSGRLHQPAAVYDMTTPGEATVTVSGDLQNAPASQSALSGHVMYTRVFHTSSAGVTVDTTVAPSGSAPNVDELYELLPIFGSYTEETEPASVVTFRIKGTSTFGAPVGGVATANVDGVRIARYGQTVEILFGDGYPIELVADDAPLPANLSPLAFQTATLLIDLGAHGGALTPTSIHYAISKQ